MFVSHRLLSSLLFITIIKCFKVQSKIIPDSRVTSSRRSKTCHVPCESNADVDLCSFCPPEITLPCVRCPAFQCNLDAGARLLQGSKNPLQDFPIVPDTKHTSTPAALSPFNPRLGLCLVSKTSIETLQPFISVFPCGLSGRVAGRPADHG